MNCAPIWVYGQTLTASQWIHGIMGWWLDHDWLTDSAARWQLSCDLRAAAEHTRGILVQDLIQAVWVDDATCPPLNTELIPVILGSPRPAAQWAAGGADIYLRVVRPAGLYHTGNASDAYAIEMTPQEAEAYYNTLSTPKPVRS